MQEGYRLPSELDTYREFASAKPDQLVLISELDGSRSYAELAGNAERLAHCLIHELGLPPGERICIWMWNRPEYVETQTACTAVGLPAVLANPQWADAEIEFVLRHSRARAIVCEPDLLQRALDLATRIESLEHVISLGADLPPGSISLESLLATAPSDAGIDLPPVPENIPGHLMYTSGTTTGRPKAVEFSREIIQQGIDYQEMFGVSGADRSIFVTPLFHGNGAGGLRSSLAHGGSAVFQRRFSARRFWQLVDRTRPTYLFTLAPIVHILLGLRPAPIEREHSMRVIIALGAGMAAPLMEERYGVPVIDWYGMTEAGMGTYTRLDEERRSGSAGRRFPDSTMHVHREDGSVADAGEVGEVCFAANSLSFQGYVEDDEANRAALKNGLFHTGDLGYFDEDGYFFFVDRKKDIVRRGGENISSAEVEMALRQHPDVADAAIVGKPDPVLGERIVAFLVPTDGCEAPDAASLTSFTAGTLATYKQPEQVIVLDELPRTASGKIEKFRLRARLAEEA